MSYLIVKQKQYIVVEETREVYNNPDLKPTHLIDDLELANRMADRLNNDNQN